MPDEWRVPESYGIGDQRVWRGVKLVCTKHHYAGDAATHPWDPGDGWKVEKAATLWAPNGRVESEKLRNRALDQPEGRLRAIMMEACHVPA